MKPDDLPLTMSQEPVPEQADELLSPLLQGPATLLRASVPPLNGPVHGVITGSLLALAENGCTAMVCFPGQPGHEALPARTTVDLHGAHIGRDVVLMFEQGDLTRPIVTGVLRGSRTCWPLAAQPATVEVDADGQRMVVTAQEQLVLRCGQASITLTKAGKVLIDGTYVLTRSSGVNRIKGGSVQLN